jgi:hypothetical protein
MPSWRRRPATAASTVSAAVQAPGASGTSSSASPRRSRPSPTLLENTLIALRPVVSYPSRVADIRIELGRDNVLEPCTCCGGRTRLVRGFVHSDGLARAIHIVRYTAGRQQHGAEVVVSIGGWCDADEASERQCLLLAHRIVDGRPTFMVMSATDSVWSREESLGRMLSRDETLESPLAPEAYAILDAASAQAPPFAKLLSVLLILITAEGMLECDAALAAPLIVTTNSSSETAVDALASDLRTRRRRGARGGGRIDCLDQVRALRAPRR